MKRHSAIKAKFFTLSLIAMMSSVLVLSNTFTRISASPDLNPCSAPSFGPASVFSVGLSPFSVAVGDFNKDGNPDLATANEDSADISILLGDGGGGFAEAAGSPHGVGDLPISVAVGDFNTDGNPDIVVANFFSENISLLLGDGNGSFSEAPGSPFSVGGSPRYLATGHFNMDGNLDLAVAKSLNNKVAILLGDGSGGFGAATDFSVGPGPSFVTVSDFNMDGNSDLALANLNSGGVGSVSVLLGDGIGGFSPVPGSPYAVGQFPQSVMVNDFNQDGNADLAVSNFFSQTVSVLLGNGNGSFGAANNFDVGAFIFSGATDDFNQDGNADLVVVYPGLHTLGVMLSDGNGGFGAITQFAVATPSPNSVSVGDFNLDGRPDLVSTNGGGSVSVFLNTCNLNTPPVAMCKDVTVAAGPDCLADASVDNGSFDPDSGDSITLSQSPAGPYPLGQTIVTLTVTDSYGASNSCQATVTVVDNSAPSINEVSASPSALWPPDHTMRDVTINYASTDNCGAVTCSLSVTSNEPINGLGDGDTAPDWEIVNDHQVRLRAERAGNGKGRIYTITITCTDAAGNTSSKAVTVSVPHNL